MTKLEKIINYIIYSFRDEPLKLGKLKLAKILWFSDRAFMYKYSEALTDLEYIKMQYGPLPKNTKKYLKSLKQKELYIFINQMLMAMMTKSKFAFIAL
ncbi:Panacea domain-containing protein [Campylobacter felis]|uniref:Panacea domain-containing protein n=1 Tax=Campylobacter felis TaxID=2974565 RepID=A0ABT7I5Y5_9BACT|nr:type II toxin-antitoxin system antitoxin SocA domain-containing protein [Campylobacter upsaliensis]MDL0147656.1 Panacea domain-containing protein [Campylobacter felis]